MEGPQPAVGTIVGEAYEIIRVVSTRGMARVFVAEAGGVQCALKVLRHDLVSDLRRFEREVRIGDEAEEDHIVHVLACGIDATLRTPWVAMELLTGESLERRLLRAGKLPSAVANGVLRGVFQAVAAAHGLGVFHHELKPSDIWLSRLDTGELSARVLDFGVARVTVPAKLALRNGERPPSFVAPEILAGQEATARSDLWSLGLLTFQALTAHPFWKSAAATTIDYAAVLAEIEDAPISQASTRATEIGEAGALPLGFDAWFDRCVSRDLSRRFAGVSEAFAALEPLLDDAASLAHHEIGTEVADRERVIRKRTETAREIAPRLFSPTPPTQAATEPGVPPMTAPETMAETPIAPVQEVQRLLALFEGIPGAARQAPLAAATNASPTTVATGTSEGGAVKPLGATLAETRRPQQAGTPDGRVALVATLESGDGRRLLEEERAKERALAKAAAVGPVAPVAVDPSPPTSAPQTIMVVKTDPRLLAVAGVIIVLLTVIVVLLLKR